MILTIVYIYTRVRAGSTAVHIPLIQFLGTKAHLYADDTQIHTFGYHQTVAHLLCCEWKYWLLIDTAANMGYKLVKRVSANW